MIRLSYSTLTLLHRCERLFQLEKLLKAPAEEPTPAAVLGTAYSCGIQEYLRTRDKNKAEYALFQAYEPCEDATKGRTLEHALSALMTSYPVLDEYFQDWIIPTFQGRPAIELSFRININENYYYVGYVDLVLYNTKTETYAVGEIKTTSLRLYDLSPAYQNSEQTTGYSLVLQEIAKEQHNFEVFYIVGQLHLNHQHKIHVMQFQKTRLILLNWLISLALDIQRLELMQQHNVFPMRGASCLQYMRPCKHFGTCHLRRFDEEEKEQKEEKEYAFEFDLNTLIQHYLT